MANQACNDFVSMLRARRQEEEASRGLRSRRRAQILLQNQKDFKARHTQLQRASMQKKLKLMCVQEQEIYTGLDDQAKWRHVMVANVGHRDTQHRDIRGQQREQHDTQLASIQVKDKELYTGTIRDDARRWETLNKSLVERKTAKHWNMCSDVMADVATLVEKFIDFTSDNGVEKTPEKGLFEQVPETVFGDWKKSILRPKAERDENVVGKHLSLSAFTKERLDVMNEVWGNLVYKVQRIMHPKPAPFRPIAASTKVNIVVLGPKYSGKSSAAVTVAERLRLKHITDIDLVTMCLNEVDREFRREDLDDPEACALLELTRDVRQELQEGKEVSRSLLMQVVVHLINRVNSHDEFNGMLLDGFPNSVEGFTALEQFLSGYNPDRTFDVPAQLLAPAPEEPNPNDERLVFDTRIEASPTDTKPETKKAETKPAGKRDKKKDEHEEPLPAIELPDVDPIPDLTEEELELMASAKEKTGDIPGLHRVIHFNCAEEVLFRRYAGLRRDSETGAVYHIELDPAPAERLPFLVPMDRTEANAAALHKALREHKRLWKRVEKFVAQFPDLLLQMDASKPLVELEEELTQSCRASIEEIEAENEASSKLRELKERRAEMERLHAEQEAAREEKRRQLAQVYTERGVDPLPQELQDPPPPPPPPPAEKVVPDSFATIFVQGLERFTEYFTNNVGTLHKEMAGAMELVFQQARRCEYQFDSYWAVPDQKGKHLMPLVTDWNGVPSWMRADPQSKEEFHLRLDSLQETLINLTDKRRDDGNTLINEVTSPAVFAEPWADTVRGIGAAMIQLELERFFLTKHLTVAYYATLKNEPIPIEESELNVDVIPLPRGQQPEVAENPAAKGKDAKKAPAPAAKKSAKKDDSVEDETKLEDLVASAVEKANVHIKTALERVQQPTPPTQTKAAPAKDKKAVVVPEVLDTSTANILAVITPEAELAKVRIATIAEAVAKLIADGNARLSDVKAKLLEKLRNHFKDDMGALHGALHHMRCVVECEDAFQHPIVLAGSQVGLDAGITLVPPVILDKPEVFVDATLDTCVTTVLTLRRALELISLLKTIAPTYQLFCPDFKRIFRVGDWQQPNTSPCDMDRVFDNFDTLKCGAIDWRELMLHLLLWSEPQIIQEEGCFGTPTTRNPRYIDGPSLIQLFDLRTELGSDPIDLATFNSVLFWFEGGSMEPQRVEHYKRLMWSMFCDATGEMMDPNKMVMYLCYDEQPLRGIQKAFAMASSVGDESCSLNLPMVYDMFHFSAVNAVSAGLHDPYAMVDLEALFTDEAELVTFQDVCSCHAGRMLLNNTIMYRRKKFSM